jgi:hypothetical protein
MHDLHRPLHTRMTVKEGGGLLTSDPWPVSLLMMPCLGLPIQVHNGLLVPSAISFCSLKHCAGLY